MSASEKPQAEPTPLTQRIADALDDAPRPSDHQDDSGVVDWQAYHTNIVLWRASLPARVEAFARMVREYRDIESIGQTQRALLAALPALSTPQTEEGR